MQYDFGCLRGAGRAKYASLLEDVDARRWYEKLARDSRITADVYLHRLGAFCQSFGRTPKDLLGMSEAELYNLLLDYVFSGKLKVGYRMNNEINYCIF